MYYCELCDISFHKREDYKEHILTKPHKDNRKIYEKANKDYYDYECWACEKVTFTKINDLTEHLESGECFFNEEELPGYPDNIDYQRLYRVLLGDIKLHNKDLQKYIKQNKMYKKKLNEIKKIMNIEDEDI